MRKIKVKFWCNIFGWYNVILDGQEVISIDTGKNKLPIEDFYGKLFLDVRTNKTYIILQGYVFRLDNYFSSEEIQQMIKMEDELRDFDSFERLKEVIRL